MAIEPSTATQGVSIVLGGAVALKLIEMGFSLAKTWIEKKTAQKIEQPVEVRTSEPVQVQRPTDNSFVTHRECEVKMCHAERTLVEWNRRIEDKLDGITKFLLEHKK